MTPAKAGAAALAVVFIAFVAAMLALIVIGFGKMVLS